MVSMRRSDDAFSYEPVVVPGLQDALIGILFNHNIQAIVVRPRLRMDSKVDLSILTKYPNHAGGIDDIEALSPQDYGPELCRLTAKVRPELDAYLVTDRSLEDIAGMDLGICRRVCYNQEDFIELHLNIRRRHLAARGHGGLVADQPSAQAHQDRHPRRAPCPRDYLPARRGRRYRHDGQGHSRRDPHEVSE